MKKFTLLNLFFILIANLSFGQSWIEQTSGVTADLQSVYSVSSSIAWICGQSGTVIKTTNAGMNWINASGTGLSSRFDLVNICGIDENKALVSAFVEGSDPSGTDEGDTAYVFRTTNGGNTWTQVFSQPFGKIYTILMTSSTDGIFNGRPLSNDIFNPSLLKRWSLFKTTNTGQSWDSTGMYLEAPSLTAGYPHSLFIGEDGTTWMAGGINNSGILYKSTNNGTSWTKIYPGRGTITTVWFNSSTNGIIGLAAGSSRTTNGGTNWSSSNITLDLVFGITGYNTKWWAVDGDKKIYYSTNVGNNWSQQASSTTNFLHINATRDNVSEVSVWAVGEDGKIFSLVTLTSVTSLSSTIPNNFNLKQNFPNPFNPSTNIEFSIPKSGNVKITIFDETGKIVKDLLNEFKAAGSYSVDLNGANLSSGIYFYTMETNNFIDTKKMVLIK